MSGGYPECPWIFFCNSDLFFEKESSESPDNPDSPGNLGPFPSLLGVFLGSQCPGVSWSLGPTPDSPWSLRAFPSLRKSFLAAPRSLLGVSGQRRTLPGVSERSRSVPGVFPRDLLERAGDRAAALPTSLPASGISVSILIKES